MANFSKVMVRLAAFTECIDHVKAMAVAAERQGRESTPGSAHRDLGLHAGGVLYGAVTELERLRDAEVE